MEMTQEYSPLNQNQRLGVIMEKWDRTGLLKNLSGHKAQVVAQLLENQAVELRNQMINDKHRQAMLLVITRLLFLWFAVYSVSY